MRRALLPLVAAALVAAAAVGSAGAGSLPGTKSKADRAAWRALLHWPNGCESDWKMPGVSAAGGSGIVTYRAGSRTLAVVTCYFGAYQGTFMLFLADADKHVTGPIPLHVYYDPGSGVPTPIREKKLLGIYGFSKGILTIFDKGVGYGGCGIYSVFKLTGTQFVPVESRAKMTCDAKPPHDPARWPKLALLGA